MKTNVLRTIVYFAIVIFAHPVKAQLGMGRVDEIEEVKKRKLLVMIEEPDEKMLKKIAKNPKRGRVEDYKSDLETLNANVKEVVEKFWPYNKNEIQYKTFDEINAIRKTKTKDYAVLGFFSAAPTKTTSAGAGYHFVKGLYWQKNIKDDFEDRKSLLFSVIMVDVIEDFGGMIIPVSYVPLYDVFPTKASMVYGIKSVESYFNQRIRVKKEKIKARDEAEAHSKQIASRTPMISEKSC